MEGKRALVTGGARRLGRAMALALAEDGFDVAVHCHASADEAEEVAAGIRASGREARVLRADLLDMEETLALVPDAAAALGGPLTLLVNSASIFERDRIETATRESWDRHLDSNLRAPFFLSQAFAAQAPEPAADGDGEPVAQAAVVNMIDQRVLKPTPEYASYAIAKAGLLAMTRTAAQALAPRVRVNAIGPGSTLPGRGESREDFLRFRAANALGRGPGTDDIVAALRYLVAAKSVTGQMIVVDGGQHIAWETPDITGRQSAGKYGGGAGRNATEGGAERD